MTDATALIWAAAVTGIFALAVAWLQLRGRPARTARSRATRDTWEVMARELNKQLSAQYEDRIRYLEAQLAERKGPTDGRR